MSFRIQPQSQLRDHWSALTPNWSLKLEYNYLSFDTNRVTFVPVAGAPFDRDVDQNIHVLKAGINYRFGGPVVARY